MNFDEELRSAANLRLYFKCPLAAVCEDVCETALEFVEHVLQHCTSDECPGCGADVKDVKSYYTTSARLCLFHKYARAALLNKVDGYLLRGSWYRARKDLWSTTEEERQWWENHRSNVYFSFLQH